MTRSPAATPARPGLRLATLLALALLACGDSEPEAPPPPGPVVPVPQATAPRDVAVLQIRELGEVRFELLADLAPRTVEHFRALAEQGAYDGTTFHRVVPGFMIQGGDPNTRDRDPRNDGLGGNDPTVPDERPSVSHVRGIVSLANRGFANTGAMQFFILVGDARHLDGHYAAFGHVTAGMDVVDRITAQELDLYGRHGPPDRPVKNVVIESVRIERGAPSPAEGDAAIPPVP
jgi:cyclophilin family peptidyl-prolyl cis-trans isomerase